MAIDPEFSELMPDICTFTNGTALDNYGKRTYGTPYTKQGRLIYDDIATRTDDQREFSLTGRFLTYGPLLNVNLTSTMTLPDNSEAIIYAIDQMKDEDGDHHTAIKFGK
jgi:hypothetical protein